MATTVCPVCGTPRTGSFRFCRSCGLDFDADAQAGPNAAILAPSDAFDPGPSQAAAASAVASAPLTTTPAPPVAVTAPRQPPADVIVIKVHHLRVALGVLVGALVGAMLAGAVVVPFFGETVLLGAVAGIVTIVVCAWLGLRVALVKPVA